jgi:hypothetical protein
MNICAVSAPHMGLQAFTMEVSFESGADLLFVRKDTAQIR